jgi:hypothetical protein
MELDQSILNKLEKPKLTLEPSIFEINRNKSYFFLLPFTEFDAVTHNKELVNCFIGDSRVQYVNKGCLYLLMKKNEAAHEHITSLSNYLFNYYVGNDNDDYFMYVIDCYCDDFFHITNGDYSKVSKSYIKKVNKFTYSSDDKKNNNIKSIILAAVTKQEWLRIEVEKLINTGDKNNISLKGLEYHEKFVPSREIYDFKN